MGNINAKSKYIRTIIFSPFANVELKNTTHSNVINISNLMEYDDNGNFSDESIFVALQLFNQTMRQKMLKNNIDDLIVIVPLHRTFINTAYSKYAKFNQLYLIPKSCASSIQCADAISCITSPKVKIENFEGIKVERYAENNGLIYTDEIDKRICDRIHEYLTGAIFIENIDNICKLLGKIACSQISIRCNNYTIYHHDNAMPHIDITDNAIKIIAKPSEISSSEYTTTLDIHFDDGNIDLLKLVNDDVLNMIVKYDNIASVLSSYLNQSGEYIICVVFSVDNEKFTLNITLHKHANFESIL